MSDPVPSTETVPGLGAAAGGHAATVGAALQTLRAGGNAVDAAVSAALAATVCEPLLTGLAGGGLMTVRHGATGKVEVLEFFSAFPGLDHGLAPGHFLGLDVDYGSQVQTFHCGRGSVAVPGVAVGLDDAWRRWGRLERAELVQPALRLAAHGWTAPPIFEGITRLLGPILALSPQSAAQFLDDGRPILPGFTVELPGYRAPLEAWGEGGGEPFVRGPHVDALLREFGPPHGSLGPSDLAAFAPRLHEPLAVRLEGATVYVPPPPCAGGALVLFGLELLRRLGVSVEPLAEARRLAAVFAQTDDALQQRWAGSMFEPGAVQRLLDPAWLDEQAALAWARIGTGGRTRGPAPGPPMGNTTHLSVVDAEGNAVSYTSSLGETCGWLWPGLGIPVNNFLGESDIHPLGFHKGPPGARFRTMMTPTLLVRGDDVVALGTGGANRIRTSMMVVLDHLLSGRPLQESILAPRLHIEAGGSAAEALIQDDPRIAAIEGTAGPVDRFDHLHLYFGGVHCAASLGGRLQAFGDSRRSGVGGVA